MAKSTAWYLKALFHSKSYGINFLQSRSKAYIPCNPTNEGQDNYIDRSVYKFTALLSYVSFIFSLFYVSLSTEQGRRPLTKNELPVIENSREFLPVLGLKIKRGYVF